MFRFLNLFPWRLVRTSDMAKLKYDSWLTGHESGWHMKEYAQDIQKDMAEGKTTLMWSKDTQMVISPDGTCVLEWVQQDV